MCTDEETLQPTFKAIWPTGTADDYEALLNIRLNKNDILQGGVNAVQDMGHLANQVGSKVTGVLTGKTNVNVAATASGGFRGMANAAMAAGKFVAAGVKGAVDELKELNNDANEHPGTKNAPGSAVKKPLNIAPSTTNTRPAVKAPMKPQLGSDDEDSGNESVASKSSHQSGTASVNTTSTQNTTASKPAPTTANPLASKPAPTTTNPLTAKPAPTNANPLTSKPAPTNSNPLSRPAPSTPQPATATNTSTQPAAKRASNAFSSFSNIFDTGVKPPNTTPGK